MFQSSVLFFHPEKQSMISESMEWVPLSVSLSFAADWQQAVINYHGTSTLILRASAADWQQAVINYHGVSVKADRFAAADWQQAVINYHTSVDGCLPVGAADWQQAVINYHRCPLRYPEIGAADWQQAVINYHSQFMTPSGVMLRIDSRQWSITIYFKTLEHLPRCGLTAGSDQLPL